MLISFLDRTSLRFTKNRATHAHYTALAQRHLQYLTAGLWTQQLSRQAKTNERRRKGNRHRTEILEMMQARIGDQINVSKDKNNSMNMDCWAIAQNETYGFKSIRAALMLNVRACFSVFLHKGNFLNIIFLKNK